MTEEMRPVNPLDIMMFDCSRSNSCFNDCCRDLIQALTPYDVLRLKNNLEIPSQTFLRTYTSMHFGPASGLPVVEFKPNPQTGNACPFVTPGGCSVYEDRPASCRMYPLARAIARSRQTGEIKEYFAMIEEPHCKGFGKKTGKTVQDWLEGQKVAHHNRCNDRLMELISLKNNILPGQLDGAQADKFYLALYDLDEFKTRIFETGLLKEHAIPETVLNQVKTDDEALLSLGMEWIKYELFGQSMSVKEPAE